MKKRLYRYLPYIFFTLFLVLFARDIVIKGYVIGPFDFLVGFYHPFMDLQMGDTLNYLSFHYKNFLMSDVVTVVLPVKLLAIDLVKKGILPLWNPYILNGTPLLANIQAALLYPLNLAYFLLPLKHAYNIYIISQLLLAFSGMYLFLKSLKLKSIYAYFGALAFSFSAFFMVWLTWGTLGHAFVWLPFILYAIDKYFETEKKIYGLIIAVSITLSLLAGHTQTTISLLLISLFYLFLHLREAHSWKKSGVALLMIAAGAGLAGLQLVPTAELYMNSVRESVSDINFFHGTTLNLSSYFTAVIPDFFGNPVTRNWWGKINYAEAAIYFGAVPLYFAIYYLLTGRRSNKQLFLFVAGLILGGIILSTDNLFSYFVYLLKIPVLSSGAFARYSVIYIVGGSIAASFGLAHYIEDLRLKKYKSIILLNSINIIFITFVWSLVLFKLFPQVYIENDFVIKRNSILPTLIVLSLVGFSTAFQLLPRLKLPKGSSILLRCYPVIVILLVSFELLRFSNKYMPFSPEVFIYPKHPLIQKLKQLGDGRYYQYFPANVNSYYAISTLEGKEPLYNKRLGELASTGATGEIQLGDRTGIMFPDGKYKARLFDLYSVKYIVDKTDSYRNSLEGQFPGMFDQRYKEVWTDGIYKIYVNNKHVPRYNIYFDTIQTTDTEKTLKTLLSPTFNPQKTALVQTENTLVSGANGIGKVKLLQENELLQRFKTSTTHQALFTLTDTYYPGWNAYIDGKTTQIFIYNYGFRAIKLPKGEHTVEFRYEPKTVTIGLFISGASLLFLTIYLLFPFQLLIRKKK